LLFLNILFVPEIFKFLRELGLIMEITIIREETKHTECWGGSGMTDMIEGGQERH